MLRDDDVDKDGYLTYSEFVRARRREEYHNARMHEDQMRGQQEQFEQFQRFQVWTVRAVPEIPGMNH